MSVKSNIGVVTDGLVFYVDAGNDLSYPGSGTTLSDLVGGNDGAFSATPTTDPTNGGSIVFDGVDDRVEVFNSTSLQTDGHMSINIWLKGNSTQNGGEYCGIFAKSPGGNFGDWACCGDVGNNYFRFGFNSTNNQNRTYQVPTSYGADLKNPVWINFQATYDMTRLKIYRNSVLVVDEPQTEAPSTETSSVYLGYRGYGSYFSGQIAVASLYKGKALSASEVLQNYNALKNRFV